MMSTMKQVYSAQNPTEAHLVRGILETRGISCEVRGDVLFGARGEIPLTHETAPSVWIEEDFRYKEARRIVQEYESANAGNREKRKSWICSSCGEELEGQFTHCWNCGSSH